MASLMATMTHIRRWRREFLLRQLSLQEGIEEAYRVGCCSRSGDGLHCVEIVHHIVKIVHHIIHGWSRRVDC